MFINTTSINTNTNNLYEYIDTLSSKYKAIYKQIEELKKGWTGTKASAFYSFFDNKYLPALNNAIQELSKYADYLSKIPTTYSYLDDCYNKEIEV